MKVEDLMIDDWIYAEKKDKLIPTQIKAINRSDGYAIHKDEVSLSIFTDENTLLAVSVENIDPIPLTKEILDNNKQNGIKLYMYIDNGILYKIDKYHYVKFVDNELPCIIDQIWYDSDGQYGDNYVMDVQYVHELQHVLKCLKININLAVK